MFSLRMCKMIFLRRHVILSACPSVIVIVRITVGLMCTSPFISLFLNIASLEKYNEINGYIIPHWAPAEEKSTARINGETNSTQVKKNKESSKVAPSFLCLIGHIMTAFRSNWVPNASLLLLIIYEESSNNPSVIREIYGSTLSSQSLVSVLRPRKLGTYKISNMVLTAVLESINLIKNGAM